VENKILLYCAQQEEQNLTAFGAKFLNYATLNYATLNFCTIVIHIMLDTCIPNLRGRS
jgi:hypothetical protein